MAAFNPSRGHAALRRGRNSANGATYFLTLCTAAKQPGLCIPGIAAVIVEQIAAMDADRSWLARCHVIMPDHLHLLVVLGDRLPLGRAVQRLKAKTSSALHAAGIAWERNFFDHKPRATEPADPVLRYIYLNPYRANLVQPHERWPHYHCSAVDWQWFGRQLDRELPIPEWLG